MEFGKAKAVREGTVIQDNMWIEPKYDGFRAELWIDPLGRIEQATGRKLDYTRHMKGIMIPTSGEKMILDAEVVVDGSLQATQKLSGSAPIDGEIRVYVFDVFNVAGEDLTDCSYQRRRFVLEQQLVLSSECIAPRVLVDRPTKVETIAQPYIEAGFEGIVAKYGYAAYGEKWLKYKKQESDDFEIYDWKEGSGHWAGTVGAVEVGQGGQRQAWVSLGTNERRNFFTNLVKWEVPIEKWPKVEVEYQQLTNDKKLRHPRMLRVRTDV